MSYRNRTVLCGLLIGSTLAIASACGGLSDVKVVITDQAGNGGNSSGGDGSSGTGGAKPSGGDSSGDSGAAGVVGTAGAAGDDASGGDGGEGGQITVPDPMPGPPTVISVSPKDQATDGEPLGVIRVSFSEPLDPASVTAASVQIKDSAGTPLDGLLTYADAVATFRPKGRMQLLGSYTVNVAQAVTDADKTPMEQPFKSSFSVRDGVWGRGESSLTTGTGGFDRGMLVLASDGGGRAVAVWAQASDAGPPVEIFASLFNQGKGWGTPLKVNTNAVTCARPSVSMNASGNVIIGWIEETNLTTTTQPYSLQARRLIGGTWDKTSTRIDVASTAAYQIEPKNVAVALAANGHSHVAWSSSVNNTTTTPSVIEYGVFARHADAVGTWDASVTPLSNMQAASGASAPALAFDGESNGFAAYQLTTGSPSKTNTHVFRFTTKWGSSAVASGAGDGIAAPVGLGINAAGDAVASWARATAIDATNTNYDLMASSYNKAWNVPVVISTAKTKFVPGPTLATATWTGASFLVAWAQSGGTPNHIYATEYKGTAWGTTAIISDGNHSSFVPWLTADGGGNALAVWHQVSDSPASGSTFPQDVAFARFLGATGKWSDYGRVSSAVAAYLYPQAVTLADGTVLAGWQRQLNNGNSKIMSVTGVFANDFH
ncbi:MAG TPA: Ig-like domain-containing protein [Polyangiaceae bacterium]|nr:Ig-like domain-containing protein [Polyangiaceae bacterium]